MVKMQILIGSALAAFTPIAHCNSDTNILWNHPTVSFADGRVRIRCRANMRRRAGLRRGTDFLLGEIS